MMFDGYHFFCLELKSVAGKSISFERTKKDKGDIHYHQIEYLKSCLDFQNIIPGLIIDFRGTDNTWFLHIDQWDSLINSINKKSFNEDNLMTYSQPILIEKKIMKVNYRYDINKFLVDVRGNELQLIRNTSNLLSSKDIDSKSHAVNARLIDLPKTIYMG